MTFVSDSLCDNVWNSSFNSDSPEWCHFWYLMRACDNIERNMRRIPQSDNSAYFRAETALYDKIAEGRAIVDKYQKLLDEEY